MMRSTIFQWKNLLAFLLLGAAILFLGGKSPASAAQGPMDELQKSVDEVLKILQSEELQGPDKKEERHQRVLNVVENMFDFRKMARSSLGQSWNDLTPDEQDRFVELFTSLVEQRYIGKIDSYENQKIAYNKQLIKGDRAMIYTDIIDKDLEIPIIYRLQKQNGKWLIYDLKIENVSLISNYRREFDSIMVKEQFEGLVAKITEQLEKSVTSD